MTLHQLDLLAVVSIVVCWCAFAATWLAAENYNLGRTPQERTRSWFGTAVTPALIIVVLGMLLGCLLVSGGGRWITPFPVFLVLLEIKLHIEERLMRAEFPDDYPRYRRRVPQLVPGLKLISGRRMATG